MFDPKQHLMQLKNKNSSSDYLPVQWRLVWFREACPDGTIETEMLHLDLDKEVEEEAYVWNNEKKRSEKVVKVAKGVAIFKATIRDGKGGIATGTKMEKAVSFGDFLEKAETGAIGRALAALGYGTQFTGDELNESPRIVDSPVVEVVSAEKTHRNEVQPQREASSNASDLKARTTALYRRAGKLNLFESVPNDASATQANFFKLVSEVLGANVTSSGQMTASRLDEVEAYVNGKDGAVSLVA